MRFALPRTRVACSRRQVTDVLDKWLPSTTEPGLYARSSYRRSGRTIRPGAASGWRTRHAGAGPPEPTFFLVSSPLSA